MLQIPGLVTKMHQINQGGSLIEARTAPIVHLLTSVKCTLFISFMGSLDLIRINIILTTNGQCSQVHNKMLLPLLCFRLLAVHNE